MYILTAHFVCLIFGILEQHYRYTETPRKKIKDTKDPLVQQSNHIDLSLSTLH